MLKLLEFQKTVSSLKKDGTNPHFKKKYTTINGILDEIKPKLSKLGLTILQPIRGGKIFTEIWEEKNLLLSTDIELPKDINPQQLGSAITYFRRYSLISLFCLETEDDDANDASAPSMKQESEKKKAPITADIIEAMKKAVLSGRINEVEKRLENYLLTEEQKKEILNGK